MIELNWDKYKEHLLKAERLAVKKNHDYGNESLKEFGVGGCFIRIKDKLNRVSNLLNSEINPLVDETIEDSCLDIINYFIYLNMIHTKELLIKINKNENQ